MSDAAEHLPPPSLCNEALRTEAMPAPGAAMRARIVGIDREVSLDGGGRRVCVNFDNAATTPPLRDVADTVNRFLEWYGSVHRGTGAKSQVSSHCYDRAREILYGFVGADPQRHALIFTRSTTDSINKLARTVGAQECPSVLCTLMEHHSNLLPWRAHCRADHVEIRKADGALDLGQIEDKLRKGAGAIRLVAVTGASNVTGLMPPIHDIARMAHAYGAEIAVDAAQLAAHHKINMGKADDPERLDYVAFSGHKMYAPFGAGVLVGPREVFERSLPESVGGGTIRMVTRDSVVWAGAPAREEAGTPNVVGAVAMAKAASCLQALGLDRVSAHELGLRKMMVAELRRIPGITVYGDPPPADHEQVAVIGFQADQINHGMLAAALGNEWGIGVRHGCFCAHPYLMSLLGVSDSALSEYVAKAERNDHSDFPGLVRISLGMYNTAEEVEYVAEAIRTLVEEGPRTHYTLDTVTGEYNAQNVQPLPFDAFAP